MACVFSNPQSVRQYSMTSPYDLSSLTDDNKTLTISGQMTNPFGVRFSPDLSKMFVASHNESRIYQYSN